MTFAPAWVRVAAPIVRRLPWGRYRTAAWLSRGRHQPFIAAFDAGGAALWFTCDLRDQIAREVCFTGMYEPQETWLFRALLGPGMTVVDVGANWGYFSLLASALVGPAGRVVSLEPEPRLFCTLADNVRRNALAHVVPIACAATERATRLCLTSFDESGGNWGLSTVVASAAPRGAVAVDGRAVDDVAEEHGLTRVDLLKMDIEGHELPALQGMVAGLRAGLYRRLVIEWHPSLGRDGQAAVAAGVRLLRNAGYRGWWIDHSPAATRAVAYWRRPPRFSQVEDAWPEDAWPHSWWLAPDQLVPSWIA